jgi:hypothetical protein
MNRDSSLPLGGGERHVFFHGKKDAGAVPIADRILSGKINRSPLCDFWLI